MGHPRVNKYRSGAKNPERQVVTSENDDGGFSVSVLDAKNFRLLHHTFPGDKEIEAPKVDQGFGKKG